MVTPALALAPLAHMSPPFRTSSKSTRPHRHLPPAPQARGSVAAAPAGLPKPRPAWTCAPLPGRCSDTTALGAHVGWTLSLGPAEDSAARCPGHPAPAIPWVWPRDDTSSFTAFNPASICVHLGNRWPSGSLRGGFPQHQLLVGQDGKERGKNRFRPQLSDEEVMGMKVNGVGTYNITVTGGRWRAEHDIEMGSHCVLHLKLTEHGVSTVPTSKHVKKK